jgi:hypothetical protein
LSSMQLTLPANVTKSSFVYAKITYNIPPVRSITVN